MKSTALSLPLPRFTDRQWLACWLAALAPALVSHTVATLTGAHWFTREAYLAAAGAWCLLPALWLAAHYPHGWGARALATFILSVLFLGANYLPFAGGCCSTFRDAGL